MVSIQHSQNCSTFIGNPMIPYRTWQQWTRIWLSLVSSFVIGVLLTCVRANKLSGFYHIKWWFQPHWKWLFASLSYFHHSSPSDSSIEVATMRERERKMHEHVPTRLGLSVWWLIFHCCSPKREHVRRNGIVQSYGAFNANLSWAM